MSKLLIILALMMLVIMPAHAKRFASQYCEFELPGGWECALEGSEWVCQSTNKQRQKEAIIILAAKIRGEKDDLDQYMAYLKGTKSFTIPGGKQQVSEAKYSNLKTINDQRWVDALHLASEVPGFYTRYLATVKEDLGVAVTFSVGKDFYASYQPVFDQIVASLRVFRQKDVDVSKFALKKKEENLLDDATFIPDSQKKVDISQQKKKGSGGIFGDSTNIIIVVIVVVVIFVILKKKGKKKKKK